MIRVAHMYSSMEVGGGAEPLILSIIRGRGRSRFEPYLILNDRKEPVHDLSGIVLVPLGSALEQRGGG